LSRLLPPRHLARPRPWSAADGNGNLFLRILGHHQPIRHLACPEPVGRAVQVLVPDELRVPFPPADAGRSPNSSYCHVGPRLRRGHVTESISSRQGNRANAVPNAGGLVETQRRHLLVDGAPRIRTQGTSHVPPLPSLPRKRRGTRADHGLSRRGGRARPVASA